MTLWRIRATVDDRPGYLSVLTASLALRGVNILAVQVHTTEAGAVDDFLVDAPETLGEAELLAAVEKGRGRNCWVARSEARGLVDQPTRVLGLATRLVRDPDATGEALRALLGAQTVTWRPVPVGPAGLDGAVPAGLDGVDGAVPAGVDGVDGAVPAGVDGTRMRLGDGTGGSFDLARVAPDFTPAEYARAQALVELAGTVVQRAAEQVTLVLPDGSEVVVRPAGPEDLPAVLALHERCSARSLHRRYLSGAGRPSPERVRRLLDPARGTTLVALETDPAGSAEVVAMANLLGEGDQAEAALLVADDRQRRGLGGALLRRLVARADRAGYAALELHVHTGNTPMLRALHRLGRPMRLDRDGPVVTVTLPLDPRPSPART